MDLWQLNIFCKVVETRSFSKAAQLVHLSQPTVSNHIKDLENYFDCRLIDRLAREAIPTKAGEILYHYAMRMLDLRGELETAISQHKGVVKGSLLIGGSTIPGGYILPRHIGKFVSLYPDIALSLIVGDTGTILDDVVSGRLEIGIVGAKTEDQRIYQEKLLEDNMQLIVPAGHRWAKKVRIRMEQLLSEPFIIREAGSGTLKSIQDSFAKKGYRTEQLRVKAVVGSTGAVIQSIKNNVGVSILSTIAVAEDLQQGTLKALMIEGLNFNRSFYLSRHRHRSLSPPAEAVIRFLKEELSKQG
jgi:DNA-binding transcriptional LysR family regulator